MIPFKSIRVGPFDISIKKLEGEELEKWCGTFSEAKHTIYLAETFETPRQEAETAIHEIMHAIYSVFGVRDKDQEERVVGLMSVGMASVIRDNPKLIEWLRKKLS